MGWTYHLLKISWSLAGKKEQARNEANTSDIKLLIHESLFFKESFHFIFLR